MTKLFNFIFFCLFLDSSSLIAQTKVQVEGSSQILMDNIEMTLPQYEERAKKEAINKALFDKFGTSISAISTIETSTQEGSSDVSFNNQAISFPNGIWIKYTEDPKFEEFKYNGMTWLRCEVKGLAKEYNTVPIEFSAKPLDGIDSQKDISYEFMNGESLFFSFRSPINGYLSIYMDDFKNTQCLLPYYNSSDSYVNIKADEEYILFSREHDKFGNKDIVDEYVLEITKKYEINRIYVIFSEKPFQKTNLYKKEGDDWPKEMSSADFMAWLQKNRLKSQDLQVMVIRVTIRKV